MKREIPREGIDQEFEVERFDLEPTPHVLLEVMRYLGADCDDGADNPPLSARALLQLVTAERDRIIRLAENALPGPREEFYMDHQPVESADGSDTTCSNEDCAATEPWPMMDKAEHQEMWGFGTDVDVRQTQQVPTGIEHPERLYIVDLAG